MHLGALHRVINVRADDRVFHFLFALVTVADHAPVNGRRSFFLRIRKAVSRDLADDYSLVHLVGRLRRMPISANGGESSRKQTAMASAR